MPLLDSLNCQTFFVVHRLRRTAKFSIVKVPTLRHLRHRHSKTLTASTILNISPSLALNGKLVIFVIAIGIDSKP